LASKTNLSTRQVSFWIYNRSKKDKMKDKINMQNSKRIGKENKKILTNYFNDTNSSPSGIEIALLANETNLSQRKIKYWFEKKRISN
jgi:hypothetical protein